MIGSDFLEFIMQPLKQNYSIMVQLELLWINRSIGFLSLLVGWALLEFFLLFSYRWFSFQVSILLLKQI